MRSIRINFNVESERLPDGQCLGNKGEHNATELVITAPEEMLNDNNVECFIIAFQIGAHKQFRSNVQEKSETVRYKVPREVTEANTISVQLEGYDSEEELIVKSDVVENLYFNNSICGEETDEEDSKSLSSEIAANTLARHSHSNSVVLEGLADENGSLIYNGNPIGSSGATERPTAEYVYDFMNDERGCMYSTEENPNSLFIFVEEANDEERAMVGKEIADVEFERSSGEWVSIKNMSEIDFKPYISLLNHIVTSSFEDMDTIVFVSVYYPSTKGWWSDDVLSQLLSKMRITYYTD